MKDEYKPVELHAKGRDRVIIELARQYKPKNVIREYVTNALDAKEEGRTIDIRVLTIPQQRRIIISDSGSGMSFEQLEALRTSVGYSSKAGKPDMRGEKGMGILAFASAAEQAIILSRQAGSTQAQYGYLLLENENNQRIGSRFKVIDEDRVANTLEGPFPNGTRVIIDRVDPNFMAKIYTLANLKAMLSELYTPALARGDVGIRIGSKGKRKYGAIRTEDVEPIEFQGDVLLETLLKLKDVDDKGEQINLGLEAFLLFNPQGTEDRVRVYSKDVLVYPSITELEEFAGNRFWGCGKLQGYVNDHFAKLTIGRDGIDRQRRQFKIWHGALKDVEKKLGTEVEDRLKRGPKDREDNLFREAWNALKDAYRQLDPIYNQTALVAAGVNGVETPVIGAPPAESHTHHRTGHPRKIIPGVYTGREKGGTFIESPGGVERSVARKQEITMGTPIPLEFPENEGTLRSKLVEQLNASRIYVNTAHNDYIARIATQREMLRYLIDIWSDQIASNEAKKAVEQRLISPEEAAQKAILKAEDIKYQSLSRLGIK